MKVTTSSSYKNDKMFSVAVLCLPKLRPKKVVRQKISVNIRRKEGVIVDTRKSKRENRIMAFAFM